MLVDKTVRELMRALASSDPTPGGGSASAAASAMGASLLLMVAGLPKTRDNSDEDRAALVAAAAALTGIQAQLVAAIDADTGAYDQVVAAYRLPKANDAERAARAAAVQRALRAATDVPLNVMRLSTEALAQASRVAAHGHRHAASDSGVAVALLSAGLRGAQLNVDINLGGIADAAYVDAVRSEVGRLSARGAAEASASAAALS
jgi:formiminotetrahydrofolate cyclodeaminase